MLTFLFLFLCFLIDRFNQIIHFISIIYCTTTGELSYYFITEARCIDSYSPVYTHLKTEISLLKRIQCFPSTLRRRNLKTEISLWKRIKCFPYTLRRRNLKTEISLWKLIKCFPSTLRRNDDRSFRVCSCFRRTLSGKSRDYRDVIVFEKLRFQNVFRPHEDEKPAFSNSSSLKSVF